MRIITKNRQALNRQLQGGPEPSKKGLSARKVDDFLRFSLFLVGIGLFYVWNSYQAEQQIKELEQYKREVKELKSSYLLKQATLSAGTRFSEIRDHLDTLGLKPHVSPPYQIVQGLDRPASWQETPERNPGQRFESERIETTTNDTTEIP
ncbi:FtsL-like putative cell division protein [Pontibacter sp. G13]|uniref:FtsL-like putative cell division protein n=1 Tax=Pontibacter sp. G13 TaxID=3074898 RepID=UPI00288975CF|nr:FtsL-like putative cell division protein [Pontibacter sp. G13]WNJ20260.1 FtsL-like putative cell division protein [Pontibacter sp. G13]